MEENKEFDARLEKVKKERAELAELVEWLMKEVYYIRQGQEAKKQQANADGLMEG